MVEKKVVPLAVTMVETWVGLKAEPMAEPMAGSLACYLAVLSVVD